MSLSSSLSWCDFPTFFVRWSCCASRPDSQVGRTSGHCNNVAHTYVQRLILSALLLISVAGLVGALRGEGSDTIVAREFFYLSRTIPIQSGIWKHGLLFPKYSICGHGVARVGISYHSFLWIFDFLWTLIIQKMKFWLYAFLLQSIDQFLVQSQHFACCFISHRFA